jgi:hypothetical protein
VVLFVDRKQGHTGTGRSSVLHITWIREALSEGCSVVAYKNPLMLPPRILTRVDVLREISRIVGERHMPRIANMQVDVQRVLLWHMSKCYWECLVDIS